MVAEGDHDSIETVDNDNCVDEGVQVLKTRCRKGLIYLDK